jgi:N-acetylmuramoyl-L-alanine amidase CwlA
MAPTTITIHNTGNANSTAAGERAWLVNPSNVRTASFHSVVDEREVIECLPLNEVGWHAGDGNGPGNRQSIGVEICESGNYAKTLDNAAAYVAGLLKERGWGVDRLRRHYDWSGKICPRLMYDGGKWTGWAAFKAAVAAKLSEEDGDVAKIAELEAELNALKAEVAALKKAAAPKPGGDIPQWKRAIFEQAKAGDIVTSDEWLAKMDDAAPVWFVLATVINAGAKKA